LKLLHYSVEQQDEAVQARYLGDTSLVADSHGWGDLLELDEAKGTMFEFQAVNGF
jgi:hypothetical protein